MLALPWWLPFGSVPEIGAADLDRVMRGPGAPVLLDVRTPGEWETGHIARSVNIPITRLKTELGHVGLDPQRPVVAVCLSGHRSAPAVRLLTRLGFRAQHLRGGMVAWRRARLPVTVRSAGA